MKIAILALFFLLLTFTKAMYVYNIKGERVSKAHSYHITTGTGIGRRYFTLADVGTNSCPLHLIVSTLIPNYLPPFPVKISHQILYPYIFTDTPLNFTFVDVPQCSSTSRWFVRERIGTAGWSLLFGEGSGTLYKNGVFSIKSYEDSYKIMSCPEQIPGTCGNVTVLPERDHRYLDVNFATDEPVKVWFEKADSGISMVV